MADDGFGANDDDDVWGEDSSDEEDWQSVEVKKFKRSEDERKAFDIYLRGVDYVKQTEFELARRFLERALKMTRGQHTGALEQLAEVCLAEGRMEDAADLLRRSIGVHPDGNLRYDDAGHTKYLMLAQLLPGPNALACYQKATDILLKRIDDSTSSASSSSSSSSLKRGERKRQQRKAKQLRKQAAEALSSAAELYLTDLCMEDNAETECQRYFGQALDIDANNTDALQVAASCRISQCRPADALDFLKRSYANWSEFVEHDIGDDDNDDDDDKNVDDDDNPFATESAATSKSDEKSRRRRREEVLPTFTFRTSTAKLFIELEQYETAVSIINHLLAEDDESSELWHMLASAYELSGDLEAAADAVANGLKQVDTLPDGEVEFSPDEAEERAHWKEMLKEVQERLEEQGVQLPELEDDDDELAAQFQDGISDLDDDE